MSNKFERGLIKAIQLTVLIALPVMVYIIWQAVVKIVEGT